MKIYQMKCFIFTGKWEKNMVWYIQVFANGRVSLSGGREAFAEGTGTKARN